MSDTDKMRAEIAGAWALVDQYKARAKELKAATDKALLLIFEYGGIDGEHHKQWVLDQVVRTLTGDGYAAWVAEVKSGEDGLDTYTWDEGIAP